MKNQLNLINNIYNIVSILYCIIFLNINCVLYIKKYFKTFNNYYKNHGLVYAVQQFKQMRLHITRYMCSQPLLINNVGVSLDKSGWPNKLSFLKELVETDEGKRFILSLLMINRVFKYDNKFKKYDINSIISKPRGDIFYMPSSFIEKFVRDFRLSKIDCSFEEKDIYLSTKSSINGPSTLTATDSILYLDYYQMQNIFDITDQNGQEYFEKLYTISFNDKINGLSKLKLNKNKINTPGKLSLVMDPELKVRVIAIFDYMSQVYLKKIHSGLLHNLKKFKSDRTFTQNPKHNWKKDSNSFWSMDLSAATDRFPIELQRRLLSLLIGEKASRGWSNLLSNRIFTDPSGQHVKYNTGQPMGAYSSWAAFTLSHHLVVQWCGFVKGFYPFTDYIILGDDIVIHNDIVAEYYKKVMDRLGVDLSEAKTHVSLNTYEFAKRWLDPIRNVEFSGIPINGIVSNITNPIIVFTILFDYVFSKQNYWLNSLSLIDLIVNLYKKLRISKYNEKLKKFKFSSINVKRRYFKRLVVHNFILKYKFNLLSDQESRQFFNTYITSDLYLYHSKGSTISGILDYGTYEVIYNSYSKLGKLAEKLGNVDITSQENLKLLPLYKSIVNYLNSLYDSIENCSNSRDLIDEVEIIDFDSIINKDRNKLSSLLKVGEAFFKGVNYINSFKDEEIYYGSSTLKDSVSFLDPEFLKARMLSNIQFFRSKVLNLKPKEEKKQTYASAYEDFWNNHKA
uniref:RNA-dependent RNA polymerase n=1 Tax=Plasmopara viticola lesion associated mitovirus 3 TaxID=2719456 RepID=A0A6G9RT76_9VIRU|nr:RNA-dependent RNA polymerase [Plasmopara viticola lesion associated mitovirus 3]